MDNTFIIAAKILWDKSKETIGKLLFVVAIFGWLPLTLNFFVKSFYIQTLGDRIFYSIMCSFIGAFIAAILSGIGAALLDGAKEIYKFFKNIWQEAKLKNSPLPITNSITSHVSQQVIPKKSVHLRKTKSSKPTSLRLKTSNSRLDIIE